MKGCKKSKLVKSAPVPDNEARLRLRNTAVLYWVSYICTVCELVFIILAATGG